MLLYGIVINNFGSFIGYIDRIIKVYIILND